MRSKLLLTSTACIALWSFSSIGVSPASANSRVLYTPASPWSVSHVRDQKGQGNDYCAMAQRFSRDAILTFAKNIHNESSLALDFQKPILGRKRTVSVTLDPGSGIQRFYEVNPVMSKAFVVRMGQDDPFFSALNKTGFLRVEIDGSSYSFNVAEIDAGQTKLNACLVSNIFPAAGDEAPLETAQASGGDSDYRREINQLRKQLADIRAENTRLSDLIDQGTPAVSDAEGDGAAEIVDSQGESLKDLETRVSELESINAELKEKAEAATQNENDLQGEVEKLLSDNKRIASQLEALQSNELTTVRTQDEEKSAEAEVSTLREEIETFKQENEALQKQILEGKEQLLLSDGMKAQVMKLEEEKSQLEAQLAIMESQSGISHSERMKILKKENEKLKAALQSGQGESQEIVSGLEEQIKALEVENQLLKQTTENAAGNPAYVSDEVVSELEEAISSLKEDIAKKDAELVSLAEQAVDMDALKDKNSELKAKLTVLEDTARAHGEIEVQAAGLKGKIRDLEGDNARLSGNLKAIMASNDASNEQTKQASSYIKRLKDENARLSRALEEETFKTSSDLEEEVEHLKDVNDELKAQLKDLRRDSAKHFAIKERNDILERELDKIKFKLDSQEIQASQNEEELGYFKAEKKRLLGEAEGRYQAIADAQKALDLMRVENDVLKDRVSELSQTSTRALEGLQSELENIRQENDTLKIRVSSLQENLVQKDSDSEIAQQAIVQLEDEKSGLEMQLASIQDELSTQEGQSQEALDRIAALQEGKSALEDRLQETTMALEHVISKGDDKKVEALQAQLAGMEERLASQKTQNEEAKNRVASLETQKTELQAQLDQTVSDLDAVVSRGDDQKVKDLQAELVALKQDLTSRDTHAQAAQEQFAALEQENAALQGDLKRVEQELAAVLDRGDGQKVAQLQAKMDTLQEDITRRESENQDAHAKIIELEQTNYALKGQLQQAVAALHQVHMKYNVNASAPLREAKASAKVQQRAAAQGMSDIAPSAGEEKTVEDVVESVIEDTAEVQVVQAQAEKPGDILDGQEYKPKPTIQDPIEPSLQEEGSAEYLQTAKETEDGAQIAEQDPPAQQEEPAPVIQQAPQSEYAAQSGVSEAQKHEKALISTLQNVEEVEDIEDIEAFQDNDDVEDAVAQSQNVDAVAPVAGVNSIAQILDQAALVTPDQLGTVEDASSAERQVYQWRLEDQGAQPIYGSAEVGMISGSANFDGYVQQYLEKTEKRCSGDFAIIPDQSIHEGTLRIDSYELACVGPAVNSAASLLFFSHNGDFTAVAHEAPAEDLDRAMEARDRVLNAVKGS